MLSKTIRHYILQSRAVLPPVYLLPCRARFISTTFQSVETDAISEMLFRAGIRRPPDRSINPRIPKPESQTSSAPPPPAELPSPTSHAPSQPSTPLSDSVKELLPLLKAQSPHYITTHIYARPYLVTQGDILRLPFHMHGVNPGDILRLNRASNIGSRDYTLKAAASTPPEIGKGLVYAKGQAYLDERLFECRAVVLGTESEPMRIKEKTKRRQRRVKTVKSKHRFTVLRIKEVRVKGLDEIE